MLKYFTATTSALLAITAFGFTLPVTRFVSIELDPVFIGLGRAAVAGVLAIFILWVKKSRLPRQRQWFLLLFVAAGVVLGFPFFSTLAMQFTPATHGGIVLAIVPLLTALVGRFVAHERPSLWFWVVSLLGCFLMLLYLRPDSKWQFQTGDIYLLLSAGLVAIGYAIGGKLAREMAGWEVICWTLVLSLPITIPGLFWNSPTTLITVSSASYAGFLYLALISQLLAFFLWYFALASGGIARISQIQLLQPFVTIAIASFWLHEPIGLNSLLFAILIVSTVFISQNLSSRT